MKRILFLVCIIIIIMLSCCSCGLFGDQEYVCEVENVASVQIVRLDKYVEGEYRYEYTVLSQINEYDDFVARLNSIYHSVNWGDPQQMEEGYVVVRIDYKNGDFDEIHPDAQCFNRSGSSRYGFFFFDDEQFNSLLSDYIKK